MNFHAVFPLFRFSVPVGPVRTQSIRVTWTRFASVQDTSSKQGKQK